MFAERHTSVVKKMRLEYWANVLSHEFLENIPFLLLSVVIKKISNIFFLPISDTQPPPDHLLWDSILMSLYYSIIEYILVSLCFHITAEIRYMKVDLFDTPYC